MRITGTMPSKKQYDLVQNDDYDSRIPLHPEEAFHHGITFQAKYIGMLDVPRPTSRVEIVAAMRRIRYEFKSKGIKKKKVTIEVSVDGVKVTLRKKKRRKSWMEDGKNILLSNPIYRIFYVSHDSQDLKIFSYIARDGASNVFKCAVFKSNKKSQAMRVVRTIGQAFEVCHKLSITAPEQEHVDQDEQETLTQDLISESLSDSCDKQKRDISDCASDRASFTQEDNPKTATENRKNLRSLQLDILPPPSSQDKKSPLTSAETYSSPHSDVLMSTGSGSGGSASLPPPGSALSSHHELQLLREQLEQQSQQTQAAMAQLQLAREQLAAEQSARMEAQARTHQLLVHNRELLDHIAALVAHLQDGEKASGQHQQSSPHVAMPQRQDADNGYSRPDSLDHSAILQALGLTPTSPLRNYNNPVGTGGGVFNYNFQEPPLDAQLLQRLQALVGYTPPQYQYPYPFMGYYNPAAVLNNNYTLQPPPQKKIPTSPLPMRNSYQGSPGGERRVSPMAEQNYHQQNCSTPQPLRKEQPQQQQRAASEDPFIKPLPQMGTLTTTDTDGHVRMIVPVPSNPADNTSNLMASLRLSDDFGRYSGPGNITRSSSERVPHRSEMMSQVQRTAWARHTTK